MTSSKIQYHISRTIFARWNREWIGQWKFLSKIVLFIFSVEAFQFSKFYESKSCWSVAFEVKNAQNYWKDQIKILQAYRIAKLIYY